MERIVFKAKSLATGEWVYGNYVHSLRFKGSTFEHQIIDFHTGATYEVDCDTVSMFIGEYDEKGESIFVGDIVKTDEAGWIGKVVFDKAMFFIIDNNGGYSYYPNWSKCEIIGNIFDNPELLK